METNARTSATWRDLAGDRYILVLAAGPADAATRFAGLVASAAAAGRPPFIVVLGDGSGILTPAGQRDAQRQERGARAALDHLGLDQDRVLFAGLMAGAIPQAGPLFDKVVAAMDLVAWRNDCQAVCAAAGGGPDQDAAAAIARAVCVRANLPGILQTNSIGAATLRLSPAAAARLANAPAEHYAPATLYAED